MDLIYDRKITLERIQAMKPPERMIYHIGVLWRDRGRKKELGRIQDWLQARNGHYRKTTKTGSEWVMSDYDLAQEPDYALTQAKVGNAYAYICERVK